MGIEILDFEEPIGVLLKEIEALELLPVTTQRQGEIEGLRNRVAMVRDEVYKSLTPWQRVMVARHPNRPTTLTYIKNLFDNFVELHGDRLFADDHAIVTGFANYKDCLLYTSDAADE